ncbi:MAG: hypothetical protein HY796_03590 [Elusimicrobia bacterium]|nr:hypothetical protein [Elusimicrobiota bacterium]
MRFIATPRDSAVFQESSAFARARSTDPSAIVISRLPAEDSAILTAFVSVKFVRDLTASFISE